ncbi:hemoglobin subunit alpha-5-like [Anomaloglossus baeobatrachus]|uniref:hemoglobin subunit alpha-5-like n=1 Tax=Anomaloglossus baeobatrachus TaxID=238106 RepID=UPI003F4FCE94
MNFSESEKAAITSIWQKIASQPDKIGAEVLERLFLAFPLTKNSFSHFDLNNSKKLYNFGEKLMNNIGEAALNLNDLDKVLPRLNELHALQIKLKKENYELLSFSIQVVLAVNFPSDFTPFAQGAWDKFLSAVSSILV